MFCVRVTFLQDASPNRAESASGASSRSGPLSVRHTEQIQQGCARPCSPAGPPPWRRQASCRGNKETGAKAQPGRREPLSAMTAGCVSLVAMLISGPVITSG